MGLRDYFSRDYLSRLWEGATGSVGLEDGVERAEQDADPPLNTYVRSDGRVQYLITRREALTMARRAVYASLAAFLASPAIGDHKPTHSPPGKGGAQTPSEQQKQFFMWQQQQLYEQQKKR